MPCKVGITRRPQYRRREFQTACANLRNWRIDGPYPTMRAARIRMMGEIRRLGCSMGDTGYGQEHGVDWFIYFFEYDGEC